MLHSNYKNTLQFVHSVMEELWGCLQFGSTVKNSGMNICEHIIGQEYIKLRLCGVAEYRRVLKNVDRNFKYI